MTDFTRAFIFYVVVMICLVLLLFLAAGCTLVSEFGDSSGCMFSEGGPVPGLSSGVVVVCRSGKDNTAVFYTDGTRQIMIGHDVKQVK